MSNPALVPCAADTWVKVATAVKTGFVWIQDHSSDYLHTYRETGDPAPVGKDEAQPLLIPGTNISSPNDIDVYIMAVKDNGEVRVDV